MLNIHVMKRGNLNFIIVLCGCNQKKNFSLANSEGRGVSELYSVIILCDSYRVSRPVATPPRVWAVHCGVR
jgi:hypothetical protein